MDGTAVIFCEGSFASDYGKTAHGLVRHTTRYDVLAVIDSGIDANGPVDSGEYLDGVANGVGIGWFTHDTGVDHFSTFDQPIQNSFKSE